MADKLAYYSKTNETYTFCGYWGAFAILRDEKTMRLFKVDKADIFVLKATKGQRGTNEGIKDAGGN